VPPSFGTPAYMPPNNHGYAERLKQAVCTADRLRCNGDMPYHAVPSVLWGVRKLGVKRGGDEWTGDSGRVSTRATSLLGVLVDASMD